MITEAPEKSYVRVKHDKVLKEWNNTLHGVHDIEYIRTDVFIEKACEWLKNNIDSYYTTNEFEQWFDEMFEDFKHYMKGD